MRTVKTLAIYISILSIIYVLNGTYLIRHAIEMKRTFAYYGVPETTELYFFTIRTYFRILLTAGIIFVTCGAIASIAVIGLFRAKEWARRIWLVLVMALSIISIPWLAWCYLSGSGWIEQSVQAAFTLILTVVSWAVLPTHPIKSVFRPDMAGSN